MPHAIFRDVTTALNTSFAMGARPPLEGNATRHALTVLALARPARNRMQADYVRRLVGTPSRTVDFSGMSKLETRAQCALVRQDVEQCLAPYLAGAILARFSQSSAEQRHGLVLLGAHLVGYVYPGIRAQVLRELLQRHYVRVHGYGNGFALRDIERRTHVPKSTLCRMACAIEHELADIEADALALLEQNFVQRGLCDSSGFASYASGVDSDKAQISSFVISLA